MGGESKLVDAGYRVARPAVELLLVYVDRWFRTGAAVAAAPGALWAPIDRARVGGGLPGRASGDVRALARNLGGAAGRAWRTRSALLHPVPESARVRARRGDRVG